MARLTTGKSKSVVGLDIEAGSIAATEVQANGRIQVVGYGVAPLAPGVFRDGEVADPEALGVAIKQLFVEHKLSRNVRLGIANQRVAVRSLRLPTIENSGELETAIRFQAQDHIPMPLDQSVLDWQVVGHSQTETGERRIDVVAVAARRDMLKQVLQALRIAGLRPVGIDHSAFGMIRALAREQGAHVGAGQFVDAPSYEQRIATNTPGGTAPTEVEAPTAARLYCNLGDNTNLAVARGSACLFTRVAAFGVEGIAQKLAERRQLTLEHARQWLVHVGLEQPLESIEGDSEYVAVVRECLSEGAGKLADELRLSIEYYGAQEDALAIEGVVVCGPGVGIPGLVESLQRDLGRPFTIATPAALAHLDEAAAARLTLSYGLALEE